MAGNAGSFNMQRASCSSTSIVAERDFKDSITDSSFFSIMLNSCCAPDNVIVEGGRDGRDFDLKQPGLHRGLNGSGCCRPLMYFLFQRLGSLYLLLRWSV